MLVKYLFWVFGYHLDSPQLPCGRCEKGVTPSPNCNCLSGIVTGATKTIMKLALFKRKGTKCSELNGTFQDERHQMFMFRIALFKMKGTMFTIFKMKCAHHFHLHQMFRHQFFHLHLVTWRTPHPSGRGAHPREVSTKGKPGIVKSFISGGTGVVVVASM